MAASIENAHHLFHFTAQLLFTAWKLQKEIQFNCTSKTATITKKQLRIDLV